MKYQDLSGEWSLRAEGLDDAAVQLPGTLDTNRIGFPDPGNKNWHPEISLGNESDLSGTPLILNRLTRNFTYEGAAYYSKNIFVNTGGKRVFLEAERSRDLSLQVNGQTVLPYQQGTVSTPYVFEITDAVHCAENTFILCCDNSYPTWPHDAIVYSSAATDETQTNWNGIIGKLHLRFEEKNFISAVRVFPQKNPQGNSCNVTLTIIIDFDCTCPYTGTITLQSPAFARPAEMQVCLDAGRGSVQIQGIVPADGAEYWDEDHGVLYDVQVQGDGLETFTARFGIRIFSAADGQFTLNGRNIFLRSETNCCVFPETGHMPMTVEEWKRVLAVYKSYGVNCMRFHSHCPPGAAFTAADEMGMLMQPELSHWNPQTAFEDDKSRNYYTMELQQILFSYANHPSFVMMTWGNELKCGALGYKRMVLLLHMAGKIDPTRLYASGSNNSYGEIGPDPISDFYTGQGIYHEPMRATSAYMRGYLNEHYPNTQSDYTTAMKLVRQEFAGPVFGFEVGQYEILPDFDEWDNHTGVTRPDNYWYIRDRVEKSGLMPGWKKRVEATGELSLLAYREEAEASLRTVGFCGISLLGLQDFPGQGTALVGMLNAHLEPKPYNFALPERFRQFFSDVVPLALLEKYTYVTGETVKVHIKIANYSRKNIQVPCILRLMKNTTVLQEKMHSGEFPCGTVSPAGTAEFSLDNYTQPQRLTLSVSIDSRDNTYPIWVYPDKPLCVPDMVLITQSAQEAFCALEKGRTVLLSPPANEDHFPESIKTQFTTDFWSVGTFADQSGFMGCMMDPQHPVFAGFPTEFYTNRQWWPMCQGRAVILPAGIHSLVTALDCYARMRNMGMLFETKAGTGRLMVSSMGLMEQMEYPEVRALTQSIVDYMASDAFNPSQTVSTLKKLVC